MAAAPFTVLAFGPFRLCRQARQLRRGPAAVPLGGRAIDLLCALAARPGEVLSHAELEKAVWPGCLVDDSCLRVHVRALRRALDDEAGAARYIANVPGRGYSFVGAGDRAGRRGADGVRFSVHPAGHPAGLPACAAAGLALAGARR